jgi:hypothetical protein
VNGKDTNIKENKDPVLYFPNTAVLSLPPRSIETGIGDDFVQYLPGITREGFANDCIGYVPPPRRTKLGFRRRGYRPKNHKCLASRDKKASSLYLLPQLQPTPPISPLRRSLPLRPGHLLSPPREAANLSKRMEAPAWGRYGSCNECQWAEGSGIFGTLVLRESFRLTGFYTVEVVSLSSTRRSGFIRDGKWD